MSVYLICAYMCQTINYMNYLISLTWWEDSESLSNLPILTQLIHHGQPNLSLDSCIGFLLLPSLVLCPLQRETNEWCEQFPDIVAEEILHKYLNEKKVCPLSRLPPSV